MSFGVKNVSESTKGPVVTIYMRKVTASRLFSKKRVNEKQDLEEEDYLT